MSVESTAEEFVRSFNERDLDAFEATLDPEVELHSRRGLVQGIPAARKWATRIPGGVQQTVVILKIETVDEKVLVQIRRDWHWDEDGTFASSDEMAWLFRVKDTGIVAWIPFVDTAEALEALNGPEE